MNNTEKLVAEIKRLQEIGVAWKSTNVLNHGSYSLYLKINKFLSTIQEQFPLASNYLKVPYPSEIYFNDSLYMEFLKFKKKSDEKEFKACIENAVAGIDSLIIFLKKDLESIEV